MITIVDYGMGNLGSILNTFKKIGIETAIHSDLHEIKKAKKIILPGVGAFDAAMQRLNDSGLREVLDMKVKEDNIPILGVCLGMQLLTEGSEEGNLPGLGWIKAKTKKFKLKGDLKIPHMGWNEALPSKELSLTKDLKNPRFYFVHSYYVKVEDESNCFMKTNYGIDFASAIFRGNVFGVQFHPEKSHKFGMKLLKNFAEI